eukprot:scaffold18511_cov63-Phaeocystis_antarctica.AAC.7
MRRRTTVSSHVYLSREALSRLREETECLAEGSRRSRKCEDITRSLRNGAHTEARTHTHNTTQHNTMENTLHASRHAATEISDRGV